MDALLPDVERIVSAYLRTHTDVVALVDDRVWTVFPTSQESQQASKNDPAVLVRRFGGGPPFTRPLVLDEGLLQIDCYGGGKRLAHDLGRTVQGALAELRGVRTEVIDMVTTQVAVVTQVVLGAFRHLPDEAWSPPRHRYVLDATVFVKCPRPSGMGLSLRA